MRIICSPIGTKSAGRVAENTNDISIIIMRALLMMSLECVISRQNHIIALLF